MAAIRQKIVPHLWFDREAPQAAAFYASILPDSTAGRVTTLHGTPSGDSDVVSFELWGQRFMAISGGPFFAFNPAISFMVNYDPLRFGPPPSREEEAKKALDRAWEALSLGGTALMPLDTYPFSRHYGWIQDRYGLSWQLILTDPAGDPRPPIVPSLLFVGQNAGKAEEAMRFYLSVFPDSRPGLLARYGPGQEPEREGAVMFADFALAGYWLVVTDSFLDHRFAFNEAVSLIVYCEDQEEIDHYWEQLSAVPEAEQCGWLKDRYGVSWQVVPTAMDEMMQGTPEQVARVTQAFLPMKKLDLAALQRAFSGR